MEKNASLLKKNEKIKFLMEQCEEEKLYFIAFAETCLKKEIRRLNLI